MTEQEQFAAVIGVGVLVFVVWPTLKWLYRGSYFYRGKR